MTELVGEALVRLRGILERARAGASAEQYNLFQEAIAIVDDLLDAENM
jgi:hypothetical protein